MQLGWYHACDARKPKERTATKRREDSHSAHSEIVKSLKTKCSQTRSKNRHTKCVEKVEKCFPVIGNRCGQTHYSSSSSSSSCFSSSELGGRIFLCEQSILFQANKPVSANETCVWVVEETQHNRNVAQSLFCPEIEKCEWKSKVMAKRNEGAPIRCGVAISWLSSATASALAFAPPAATCLGCSWHGIQVI